MATFLRRPKPHAGALRSGSGQVASARRGPEPRPCWNGSCLGAGVRTRSGRRGDSEHLGRAYAGPGSQFALRGTLDTAGRVSNWSHLGRASSMTRGRYVIAPDAFEPVQPGQRLTTVCPLRPVAATTSSKRGLIASIVGPETIVGMDLGALAAAAAGESLTKRPLTIPAVLGKRLARTMGRERDALSLGYANPQTCCRWVPGSATRHLGERRSARLAPNGRNWLGRAAFRPSSAPDQMRSAALYLAAFGPATCGRYPGMVWAQGSPRGTVGATPVRVYVSFRTSAAGELFWTCRMRRSPTPTLRHRHAFLPEFDKRARGLPNETWPDHSGRIFEARDHQPWPPSRG